jgi:hypothetical protein
VLSGFILYFYFWCLISSWNQIAFYIENSCHVFVAVLLVSINHNHRNSTLLNFPIWDERCFYGIRKNIFAKTKLQPMMFVQRCCWRRRSPGMWKCIIVWEVPDLWKDRIDFIFRVKQSKKDGPLLFTSCFSVKKCERERILRLSQRNQELFIKYWNACYYYSYRPSAF